MSTVNNTAAAAARIRASASSTFAATDRPLRIWTQAALKLVIGSLLD